MSQLIALVLPVFPLLALLVALLLGRYPGCEAIFRLSERIAAAATRRRPAARLQLPLPPRVAAPAGGLLLARWLSGRAPPVRLAD